MKKVFAILFLFTLIGCDKSPSSEREIDAILDEFEWQLQKDLRDDNLNGSMSMVIVKGDQIIRSKAFGISDLKGLQADTNNIYRIGSISKSFTAFLMMQLIKEGTISLDEPVEKYLPEVRKIKGYSDSTKFTFRQLASHTSGLTHLPHMQYRHGSVEEWESILVDCLPFTDFTHKPGEKYNYSNIGFGILGLALSRASDKPFIELMQTKVFDPLGMTNTFYTIPKDRMQHWAHGRSGGPMGGYDDERPEKELVGRSWAVPNGGIWSTANDLARFMICNMGYSQIVSQDDLIAMQTTQTPEGSWEENYGLGFTIYQDSIVHTIGHQGGTPGYRANLLFETDSQYGVVLLRNYNWGITDLNLRSTVLLRELKEVLTTQN
ncbi:serine hydrolase domain-containing protein [Rhodocytophaga aerolata]|uniref:Serine hydrolase domain-containing protein n=1 Tax=Rhodocytophaga aerolata TaxID=455078 RepID=A0ABT8RE50_9BACT|nr:serine hydrolase domain-containing protein [Rhodocytophaga aerolata]MDO1450330.1 serine hydrolase domain-containing protein [Rhodocytophaga aerolata]